MNQQLLTVLLGGGVFGTVLLALIKLIENWQRGRLDRPKSTSDAYNVLLDQQNTTNERLTKENVRLSERCDELEADLRSERRHSRELEAKLEECMRRVEQLEQQLRLKSQSPTTND